VERNIINDFMNSGGQLGGASKSILELTNDEIILLYNKTIGENIIKNTPLINNIISLSKNMYNHLDGIRLDWV
jgi:hypothetical protein